MPVREEYDIGPAMWRTVALVPCTLDGRTLIGQLEQPCPPHVRQTGLQERVPPRRGFARPAQPASTGAAGMNA